MHRFVQNPLLLFHSTCLRYIGNVGVTVLLVAAGLVDEFPSYNTLYKGFSDAFLSGTWERGPIGYLGTGTLYVFSRSTDIHSLLEKFYYY